MVVNEARSLCTYGAFCDESAEGIGLDARGVKANVVAGLGEHVCSFRVIPSWIASIRSTKQHHSLANEVSG